MVLDFLLSAYLVCNDGSGRGRRFSANIELGENELGITHNFRRSVIPRANIEKATWAKGCGVSLVLKDGSWVQVPDIGLNSQGLCNSVRAWAKGG